MCCGGEVRTRIANTNRFRHHQDPNNITDFSGRSCACNGPSMLTKVSRSRGFCCTRRKPWRKVLASEIAGKWFCWTWFFGLGCAIFSKHRGGSDDELVHRGICCCNGITTPFEEKRLRLFQDGVATNGFHKEGDRGNVDWYLGSGCVGNGSSCSWKRPC